MYGINLIDGNVVEKLVFWKFGRKVKRLTYEVLIYIVF